MSARSPGGPRCVALLVVLAVLLAASEVTARASEAAQATPPSQAPVQRGAGRVGQSPTILGDINNDGIVDVRDYGLWRQAFGSTTCGNAADLTDDCVVDTRDYGVWRQNFGQTLATTCIPVGAICQANVSTAAPNGTIALGDCANPADPVNCARLVSVANGFTVTGRFGTVQGTTGLYLTIAVVDATTGVPSGARTVNCPGSSTTCNNVLVSGNVRPQIGGTAGLSSVTVSAPDTTASDELAVAAPDGAPT